MIISLCSDLSVKILFLFFFLPVVSETLVSCIAKKMGRFLQYVYCNYYYKYVHLNEVIVTSLFETVIQLWHG